MTFSESIVEDAALAWPEALGYAVAHGPGIVADELGEAIPTPEDIFGTALAISAPSSPNLDGSSPNLDGSSSNLTGSSSNLATRRNDEGCLLSDQLSLPIIEDLAGLSVRLRQRLEVLAAEARSEGKISIEKSIAFVLALCKERFVTESAP